MKKILFLVFAGVIVFTSGLACNGVNEIKSDEKVDAKLAVNIHQLKEMAQNGHVEAQFTLGGIYYYGRGVTQDYKEAVKWYRMAAEKGDAMAQNNLGKMYETGLGVEQDYVEAYKWALLTENNGFNIFDTSKERSILKKEMTSEQIAEALRLAKAFVPK